MLEYFRLRQHGAGRGRPVRVPRQDPAQDRVRGAAASVSCRRRWRATGRTCPRASMLMPSYVNIGAWVGPRTMVDTWATVGSCAQIGADVHLAGGVGIGGVLEPAQARPVIVEDGVFVGSRAVIVEGRDRRRAGGDRAARRARRLDPDHRRQRARARRAPRLRAAALGRPPRDAAARSSPPGPTSSRAR